MTDVYCPYCGHEMGAEKASLGDKVAVYAICFVCGSRGPCIVHSAEGYKYEYDKAKEAARKRS